MRTEVVQRSSLRAVGEYEREVCFVFSDHLHGEGV